MIKFFKKNLFALTLLLGMTFAAPQQTFANGLPETPQMDLGFKLKNLQLEIVHLEGTDIYLLICRDGDTGSVVWAKTLGGDSL